MRLSRSAARALCAVAAILCVMCGNLKAEERMPAEGEKKVELASFAGGCFWCMEPAFDALDGVLSTTVGYTGGKEENPTYEEVSTGRTGHAEAVLIEYDPQRVSFEKLLDTFWRNIDPTQADGQFADRGPQYRTIVFFHNEEQRRAAEASKQRLAESGKFDKPIVTTIEPAGDFYRAEESHQEYYKKNSVHYNLYKVGSGRAGFIERTWKRP